MTWAWYVYDTITLTTLCVFWMLMWMDGIKVLLMQNRWYEFDVVCPISCKLMAITSMVDVITWVSYCWGQVKGQNLFRESISKVCGNKSFLLYFFRNQQTMRISSHVKSIFHLVCDFSTVIYSFRKYHPLIFIVKPISPCMTFINH